MRWLLALAMLSGGLAAGQVPSAETPTETASFYERVDLSPLDTVTVWTQGRLKSFESYARDMMNLVSGPRRPGGLEPRLVMLDLIFRPSVWSREDLHWVKNKLIRVEIARVLRDSQLRPPDITDERLDRFVEHGLAPRAFLVHPDVRTLLGRMRTDVLRFARPVGEITTSLRFSDPELLEGGLSLVPPIGADALKRPWRTLGQIAELEPSAPPVVAWSDLRDAWVAGDADGVNSAATTLAASLRTVNPAIYPSMDRLRAESMYFQWNGFTWSWIIYILAVAVLLMWVVYRWRGAYWGGLALFLIAFGLHSASVILRAYISGRWPNTNMFEAVTTSAWYGGVFAIILEIIVRRTRMRGLFLLGSALCSMVAMMAANLDPVHLNPAITNKMPVLHDLWLHIHTNVIIFSYVLIFLASMMAVLYLLRRWALLLFGRGGTSDLSGEFARAGGAGFLMVPRADGTTGVTSQGTTFGQVLDGATMVLVELSFILLWAGLVMGAIWADHSWGRPWGWDPKEVFALNTFIIFVLLIHVRFKVRDKGLWTAWLAVIGAIVMIFNWVIINFTISGLHSYA